MGGLFTATSGSLSKFVKAWLLPSATAVCLFAFLLLPVVKDVPIISRIYALSDIERGLVLAFSILLTAFLTSHKSTAIYRLLEGYTWPKPLAAWATNRQMKHHKALWAAADDPIDDTGEAPSKTESSDQAWHLELAVEELRRYPEAPDNVLPTRLGNAFKALERYGSERYGLDSQLFWSELNSCAPPSVRDEVEDARSMIDFFVSFVFLSLVFGVSSFVVAIVEQHALSAVIGVVALASSRYFYNAAVQSTPWYRSAVQALVNLGRAGLANANGLNLPTTLAEERKMWETLNGFVMWGGEEWAKALDDFRQQPQGKTDSRVPDG
jgi:hypothetical protein